MTPDEGSSPAAPDAIPVAPDAKDSEASSTSVVPTSLAEGAPPSPADGAAMSLVDHLVELRNRIGWSLLAVGVGSIVGFALGEPIIKILTDPLPIDAPLRTSGIGDAFAIRIQIAIIVGIILAMPVLLWHVWRFIAPGLTQRERRAILPWIPAALVFFVMGVSIAYIVLPFAAAFLLSFQTAELQPLLLARDYFSFVTTLFLAFGLLMEFPILLVGLSRVGIVTSERLRSSRRMIILGIAVFSAVATPGGDMISPTVLGVTLYILFEGTVVVIRRSGR
jgi:sec-independent protein translocase protein TatC